jgi:hypothetical protein
MLARRLGTALLALLFSASAADAMMLCAGMAMAADSPHACCVGEAPKPTTPGEAVACCAMAERTDDQGPTGAPAGVHGGLVLLDAVPGDSPPGMAALAAPREIGPHRASPSVPVYLQHRSLLI